jgi:two-component system, NarL family, nitrate/nitrite response regulator NarL
MTKTSLRAGADRAQTQDPLSEVCRVLLVDDHSLILEVMSVALQDKSTSFPLELETATTVEAALQKIELRGPYDVVLLDYQVPGMSGLDGLRAVISSNGGSVVLFSGNVSRQIVEQAMEIGASGYIPKTLQLKTLRHAIQFVANGEVFLPAEYMRNPANAATANLGLKPRETRVLGFLCQGLQNKQIGRELDLEETIVKLDVKSICRKLGVRNRTQAVIEAGKLGLY